MLVLAGALATASAQTAAPFTLRISGSGTVAAGQPVRLRVLLQNTSDHAIGVMEPNAILMDGSVLSIEGPSGQQLPQKNGLGDFSGGLMSIEPGEVSDDVLRVDSFYDLSQPGRYTLQLKRPISEDRSRSDYLKAGSVSSNIITLAVLPEKATPSAPLTLTLTGPQTFVSGSEVSVKALVKNISGQDIFLVTGPGGNIDDRYYRLDTAVGPNNAEFPEFLAHVGPRVIRTISPGATLDAGLDKTALRFNADWIAPRTYRFHLIYSATADWENTLAESNILTVCVKPQPGGPGPLALTLSGPETVAAGDAVRVDLALRNRSNFEIAGPVGQLNLLREPLSIHDASGRELPLNEQADDVKGANAITAVQPGKTVRSYAVLSPFYDLSQPGTYSVRVSLPAHSYPEARRVFSNVLTIHVTPTAGQ